MAHYLTYVMRFEIYLLRTFHHVLGISYFYLTLSVYVLMSSKDKLVVQQPEAMTNDKKGVD